MKFAVPYFRKDGGNWMDSADEIIIKYTTKEHEKIVEFIQEHSSQRIIVDVLNFDDFSSNEVNTYLFKTLKEKYNLTNWALRFDVSKNEIKEVEKYLIDRGFKNKDNTVYIDYFYSLLVETYEQLDRLIFMNVSDVYITNSLAFDLERVKQKIVKSSSPLKIRVYPNICQSYWEDAFTINSFFIRPEDINLYEDYVDVAEIYAENIEQKKIADIYLEIYQKNQSWYGDLKEYLINCNESIYNPYIFKDFGKRRIKCKKRCLIDNRCRYCLDQIEYIALMEKTHSKITSISSKIDEKQETDSEDEDIDIKEYIGETDE